METNGNGCSLDVIISNPFIFTVLSEMFFLNRRRGALYTRLPSVDNTRPSRCFFKMVKMWIKEIRS